MVSRNYKVRNDLVLLIRDISCVFDYTYCVCEDNSNSGNNGTYLREIENLGNISAKDKTLLTQLNKETALPSSLQIFFPISDWMRAYRNFGSSAMTFRHFKTFVYKFLLFAFSGFICAWLKKFYVPLFDPKSHFTRETSTR